MFYMEFCAATQTDVFVKTAQAVVKCKKEDIFRQHHINIFGLFIAVKVKAIPR